MQMTRRANYLSINQGGKGIPYGGVARENGDVNHGFKYVKGDDEALRSIPELLRDPALLDLALDINASETGLFSIGCVSDSVQDDRGHRDSGYIEFAINSRSAIADAQSYFPLFFHFDRLLHSSKFSVPASFNWELSGATFFECNHAVGFTCSVFVNTGYVQSREEAGQNWTDSLSVLGYFLRSVPPEHDDFLYPQ
jgi:hypothetical protein